MTDERIKEEFEKTGLSQEAIIFSRNYQETQEGHRAIGFYAGFRIAERLAKIEAAEEARKRAATRYGIGGVLSELDDMISELKEANR